MRRYNGLNGLLCAAVLASAMIAGPASTGLADSGKIVPADINQIPASIVQLISGGYWSRDKQEGFFRVIVSSAGTEHVGHSLYLQWVQVDPESGNAVITAATGVGELNQGDTQTHLLEVKQVESELGTLRLSIVVSRERSNDKLSDVLAADGTPGKYKFKQSK